MEHTSASTHSHTHVCVLCLLVHSHIICNSLAQARQELSLSKHTSTCPPTTARTYRKPFLPGVTGALRRKSCILHAKWASECESVCACVQSQSGSLAARMAAPVRPLALSAKLNASCATERQPASPPTFPRRLLSQFEDALFLRAPAAACSRPTANNSPRTSRHTARMILRAQRRGNIKAPASVWVCACVCM